MQTAVHRHFAIALKELQTGVTICCWVIGIALLAQVIAWSLVTYTDIRYVSHESTPDANVTSVVQSDDIRRELLPDAGEADPDIVALDVNRQFSKADHLLAVVSGLSGALGTMAILALLPLLGLAVVLGAGAATPGVDRAAGAFVWAVVLVTLALPWGSFFEAMPFDGLFANYEVLTSDVEIARSEVDATGLERATSSGLMFYGRYCILPLACVAGIAAIGLRFRAGIEAGLISKENYKLDPELEKEVAGLKATSLMGGSRSTGAFKAAVNKQGDENTAKKAPDDRPISQLTAGDRPNRPI